MLRIYTLALFTSSLENKASGNMAIIQSIQLNKGWPNTEQ